MNLKRECILKGKEISVSTTRKLLGQRIKELRQAKGLKQSQLAENIGIEPRSVSKIESGFHFPKDEHLQKIANTLGVEIKDLFETSHLKSDAELVEEINGILSKINSEKLKQIYKVIEAMIK